MAARKPKIEYYWQHREQFPNEEPVVNWRLVGANGEIVCQSTQGHRDKTDAKRAVQGVAGLFHGDVDQIKHVGPGKKPA